MRIRAKELHRLIYNAILFTDKKSAAGGMATFVLGGTRLAVMATDDHVAIRDYITVEPQDGELLFFLPLESMKELEKELRGRDDDYDFAVADVSRDCPVQDPGFWNTVGQMLSLSSFDSGFDSVSAPEVIFALNPDRLRKFSLLKPGDYPIDMRYGYDDNIDRDLVAFKAGPTLCGVLAPLDRGLLAEKFGEEAERVMW